MMVLVVLVFVLLCFQIDGYYLGNKYISRYQQTFVRGHIISIEEARESLNQWNEASSLGKYDNIETDTFTIGENHIGESVADFLSKQLTLLGTKNRVHKVCRSGLVLRNGGKVYSSAKLQLNDVLTIDKKGVIEELKVTNTLNDIDLNRLVSYTNSLLSENQNPSYHTIYEDNNLAVVFKPAGVHSLRWTGTMKKRIFALDDCLPLLLKAPTTDINDLNQDISLPKPLPQHRLDARVAGCLVVAKSRRAAVNLHQQFEQRIVKKEYRAILVGRINTSNPRNKL
jgi:23S rRNA-/tRNA-specific pseudouridylate synthase